MPTPSVVPHSPALLAVEVSAPQAGAQVPQLPPLPSAPEQAITVLTSQLTLTQLKARGQELATQLNSVTSRRDKLAHDLRRTNTLAQDGILEHIKQLDARTIQLEADINANSRAAADRATTEALTPRGLRGDYGSFRPSPEDMIPITIVFTLFVLCPIALSISRLLWKRGNRPVASKAAQDSDARLARVEEAVDAIAVEIERISEGQRFVTQLLSKPAPQALGVGHAPAEPVRVSAGEPLRVAGPQTVLG